jgi:hypothetical protein
MTGRFEPLGRGLVFLGEDLMSYAKYRLRNIRFDRLSGTVKKLQIREGPAALGT